MRSQSKHTDNLIASTTWLVAYDGLVDAELEPRQRAGETKRARTRAALLDAVQRLSEERDWPTITLQDICVEAGVSKPSAYNHFTSKNEMVGQIFAELFRPTIEAAAQHAEALKQREWDVELWKWSVSQYLDGIAEVVEIGKSLVFGLLMALQEEMIRRRKRSEPDGAVHALVPIDEPLAKFIDIYCDHQPGHVRAVGHDTAKFAWYHISLLLNRMVTYPDQPAHYSSNTAFGLLMSTLTDPDEQMRSGRHRA